MTAVRTPSGLGILGAGALGAGLMYFLDHDRGQPRRALVRDRMRHAAHRTQASVDATSRDMASRARGVVAELRGRLDRQRGERRRAREARARAGRRSPRACGRNRGERHRRRVALGGPILAEDLDRLLRRVRAVRGVKSVDALLEVHAEPANVPGLQGLPRPARGGQVFELRQEENWSPTVRVLKVVAGGVMTVWGLRRRGVLGSALVAAGLALAARGFTNTLHGEGAGRAAARARVIEA